MKLTKFEDIDAWQEAYGDDLWGYCLPFGQGTLVLWEGSMDLKERIEVNPKVMMGKPVIKGTRIPVELILRKLSEGATEQDLLDAYPHLSHEDILAALAYAGGGEACKTQR